MTYAEQLLHQNWLDKRAVIITRDDGICCFCLQAKRLFVHHAYYIARRKAWEYPDDSLVALCNDCHKMVTDKGISGKLLNWETAACAVLRCQRTIIRCFT